LLFGSIHLSIVLIDMRQLRAFSSVLNQLTAIKKLLRS